MDDEPAFPLTLELLSKIPESTDFRPSKPVISAINEIFDILKFAAIASESFRISSDEFSDEKVKEHAKYMGEAIDTSIDDFDKLLRQTIDLQNGLNRISESLNQVIDDSRRSASTITHTLNETNYEEKKETPIHNLVDHKYDVLKKKYDALEESKRYGPSRTYANFRQEIWNVNNKDDIMPDINRLFSDFAEDDDFIEERARESYKCPLTKRFYEDPVTSKVCNHSFSRMAIMEVIRNNSSHRYGAGRVKCPIPACSKNFGAQDLEPNANLAERALRDQEREIRETQAQNATIDRL